MRRCHCRRCDGPSRSHKHGYHTYYVGAAGLKLTRETPRKQALQYLEACSRADAELVRVWTRSNGSKQYDVVRGGKWVSEYEGHYGVHSREDKPKRGSKND